MLETAEMKPSQALVPVDQTPQNALMTIDVPALEQSQREAVVDLLLLGMYADRHISVIEQDLLATEMTNMGWDEYYSPSIYLQRAVPMAREAIVSEERTTRYLDTISQRLDDVDVMKFAIEKFSAMLCLDGNDDSEAQLLDQVMEAFFATA